MTIYEKFSVTVSILAIVVAAAGIIYTAKTARRFRRDDAEQEVRTIVVQEVAKFNGIRSVHIAQLEQGRTPDTKEQAEYFHIFSRIRNSYTAQKHHFNSDVQKEIDTALAAPASEKPGSGKQIAAMADAVNLLHKRLIG